jgi:hypothetical protein
VVLHLHFEKGKLNRMDTVVAQSLSATSWIYFESKVFHYQRTILKKTVSKNCLRMLPTSSQKI